MALSGRKRDSKTAISQRRRQCTRHWPWTNSYFSHFPEILEISTLAILAVRKYYLLTVTFKRYYLRQSGCLRRILFLFFFFFWTKSSCWYVMHSQWELVTFWTTCYTLCSSSRKKKERNILTKTDQK